MPALASAAYSEHLLQIALWSSLGLLVLMLLLLLQIALLRINLISRTEREKRFLEIWRPQMTAIIIGGDAALPTLNKGDEIFFLKLWNHLHESLRGVSKTRLNTLAARYGLWKHAHSLLDKHDLGMQLLALNTLGHLEDRSAWEAILQMALRPDPLLSLAAARALFQIDTDKALQDLQRPLLEREDWPVSQLALLLQQACTKTNITLLTAAASRLANSTATAELNQLKRLLHLLEVAPCQQVLATVRNILAATMDDEIIVQCLKFLRDPNDLPAVLNHLHHPGWLVRLQVSRALGRIGTTQELPSLITLLGDPVWWVRYRAAQAIVALTHNDPSILSELRAKLSDRYALDMLETASAERT